MPTGRLYGGFSREVSETLTKGVGMNILDSSIALFGLGTDIGEIFFKSGFTGNAAEGGFR
jgi:hypothetical protein